MSLIIVLMYTFDSKIKSSILKRNLKNYEWINNHVTLTTNNNFSKKVMSVEKSDAINIYNSLYQKAIEEKITKLKKDSLTLDNALIIYNPYGTNNLSFNIYFNTDELASLSYKISVDDDSISDFERTLNNEQTDNLTTEHSYQLLGFVPGVINHLTLTVSNKDKEVIATRTIDIDMSSIESKAATKLETTDGSSTEELSNGLYTLLGLDKTFNANTYLYDNDGILRGELVLNSYRSDRIIFIGSDMLYSYSKTGIARVNRLGKVVKKYTTTGYYMHHDYVYDEDNNNLLILANKNEASTIEDKVISINLETSQVKEVVDMKELLGNMYKTATSPKGGNTYGGNELDWIHLNSLQVVNGQDIVLSSRELSTIIYIENAYASPKIKYLISDESMYKDTTYKNLLLTKEGTFTSNAGQHTITYTTSSDLADGQYYLEMYNNNYGSARTRPDFSWKNYEGVGTYNEGDKSLYYKYLVDENKGTYKLVEKVELPYSSIVSSVQKIDGNLMTSSGMSNLYDEYDSNNELIREFKYSAKKYAYRVFKYKYSNLFVD